MLVLGQKRKPFDRKAKLAYVKRYNGAAFGLTSTTGYNHKYNVARTTKDEVKTAVGFGPSQDDCTNFVSQALFAGGWKPTPEWNYQHKHLVLVNVNVPLVGGVLEIQRQKEGTPAWQSVEQFRNFAVSSGRAKIAPLPLSKAKKGNVQLGDVILLDKKGRPPGTADFKPDHAMIVVGFRNGIPLIASHDNNRAAFPLYGSKNSIKGLDKHGTFEVLHILP
jgi:hypothetical protein